jgi:V/A-type H+-transporting ATPase subunit K
MDSLLIALGWAGIYGPVAFGAMGSVIGCARGGQAACGAMLDVEGGYGRFIGLSAMPSTQVVYGIVIMFSLQGAVTVESTGEVAVTAESAGALSAIGLLVGLALLISGMYQGACCASAINASKSKPEIFGLSAAPAGIVEGFIVFAFVFALVLSGDIPSPEADEAKGPDGAPVSVVPNEPGEGGSDASDVKPVPKTPRHLASYPTDGTERAGLRAREPLPWSTKRLSARPGEPDLFLSHRLAVERERGSRSCLATSG